MIGHQNNSGDIEYALTQLGRPGFYLGFDRVNPLECSAAEDNIVALVKRDLAEAIIGQDNSLIRNLRPENLALLLN